MSTVSPVAPTSSSTSTSTAAAASSTATVNYNDFLQLMVSELKNQDPTQPTDPTQYLSQLASFSQVEQQLNTNNKLSTMMTSQALEQADATIGKTVTSSDGSVTGTVSSVAINSSGGLTATLSNGNTLVLGNGETLS
ncbi:MAG: flagellar hook assembly protein FlgD [Beijerinckiaceae bacterium]|nr:flagellar hook assembly protein FlgD [Beijerinckiaceae bacterium]